jgi:hypothetical protein
MTSRVTARLARLEHNARTGSRRIVVVERESLEVATAFLQGRPDLDMGRIIFVITGSRAKAKAPKTGYARLAGPDVFGIAMRGKLSATGRANLPPKTPTTGLITGICRGFTRRCRGSRQPQRGYFTFCASVLLVGGPSSRWPLP